MANQKGWFTICCKLKRITAAEVVSKSTCFLNC